MPSSYGMTKISYVWIWSNKRIILKLLSPVIILICFASAIYFSGIQNSIFYLAPIYLVGLYIISMSMVQIHRIIILPSSTFKTEIFPKHEKPFVLYLGTWMALYITNKIIEKLADHLLSNPESYYLYFAYLPIVILSTYVYTRAYFILPAIAVKKDLSFVLSITENKFWIVFKSILLVFIPFLLLYMVGIMLVGTILSLSWMMPFIWIMLLIGFTILNIHYSTLFSEFSKSKQSS